MWLFWCTSRDSNPGPTDLEQALRILRGSKQYNFNGTVLTVIGYYTGKRISLDLGKLDADMLEALTPDEEADDGDIW